MTIKRLLGLMVFLACENLLAGEFVVHEWGTFTSFQAVDGTSMYGLHRGDEPLPQFVYLRNPEFATPVQTQEGCQVTSYSCDFTPVYMEEPVGFQHLGVTQRMETPVVYFHSDVERDVQVKVDFPNGIITEWFPSASTFTPEIGKVDWIGGGSMTWDVHVHTRPLELPAVAPDSIWLPSRQVRANDISVGSENERLIFYRGVGDFATEFMTSSVPSGFKLINLATLNQRIPIVLYLHVTEAGGYVRNLGPLSGQSELELSLEDSFKQTLLPMQEYEDRAAAMLVTELQQAGLYEDEAHAMVNTWRKAYFHTPGERFLYVLPREWTDSLLPMQVSPVPDRLERVLVGRVEVMNYAAQFEIYQKVRQTALLGGEIPDFPELSGGFREQVLNLMFIMNRTDYTLKQEGQLSAEEREQLYKEYNLVNTTIESWLQ